MNYSGLLQVIKHSEMLFWSCLVKIFLGIWFMLLRLDFFPGNQIHSGINDNLFYYTVDISSAAWLAQRAPCACIAERRGRLPTRMLRRVRRSGQEQRCLRLPANGGGRGPSVGTPGAPGCQRRPRAPAALGKGHEPALESSAGGV